MTPVTSPRTATVIADVRAASEAVQIAPAVAPPAMPNAIIVDDANPMATIQRLPVQRQLSLQEIRTTRSMQLGSATVDLSAMLEHRDALPNIARRLEANPAVTVRATDVNAFVIPQGLIVRSFLNYRIKPGSCLDPARRRMIEQDGINCATRESEASRVSQYSNPASARYVADPAKRATAINKARRDWAEQDAEAAAQVANFRAILANPAERGKVAAEIGQADLARLEGLSDEALAGELISAAETKIEDVMFIPKEDEVDRGMTTLAADFRRHLDLAVPAVTVETESLATAVYLTGFTLGRQYEWSKRVEKTIKWCLVGCATTYYAGARASFSYGFGLRFPIVVDGKFRTEKEGLAERAFLIATMTPVDGSPAQYSAAGLNSSQIFKGQEFVAELKASAGYDYKLPLIGEDHRTLSVGYDLAEMLPHPYTNGHFTPPAPGTTSGEIPFIFRQVDLLMGYGNWGAAGVLVHPAVKVGLHSDSLRMTVHDEVSGTDQLIVNGKKLPLAIDRSDGMSRFSIGSPVYNLGFIVTPGVDAHAFIDVGVWSNSWDFPVWFPDIAIKLPPGGIDFSCHSGTVCKRSYAYKAGSIRPVFDSAVAGAIDRVSLEPAPGTQPDPTRPPLGATAISRPGGLERLADPARIASACPDGLVERRATREDRKCVTLEERKKVALENRQAASNRDPNGAYGPRTCIAGLVWREAAPGDQVCVTPQRRDEVARMNR